jgi:flagellar hook protein FlgE
MTPAISSGLQGYDRAEATVNTAAAQIANYPAAQTGTSKPGTTPADSADLSTTAVSLLQGKNSAQANLATIHVADQMQKSLIDMLG